MSDIKIIETTKLFYDKFFYKLTLSTPLSVIFRGKNLTHAREVLDKLQTKYENNQGLVFGEFRKKTVSVDDLKSAQLLLSQFIKQPPNDFLLRIEGTKLSIYTNNEHWLKFLLKQNFIVTELAQPSSFGLSNLKPNQIIMDKEFGYEFKVSLKDFVDANFYKWVINNPQKVKIGNRALESIEKGNYTRGFYLFVKDAKVLNLVRIIIGKDIARIDNIITTHNIDK